MSYIAFELDALNVVPDVAAAAGITPGAVAHGLLKLWAWCFREEAELVSDVHLKGFFGVDAGPALSAFGFLEWTGTEWRVKGADRYRRVANQRREAGKSRAASAGRFAGRFAGNSTSEPPANHQRDTSGSPALTPSTEHRAPNTKRSVQTANAATPPRDSDELVRVFKEVTGAEYLWQGAKDGVALARLLKATPLAEVLARWRRGLSADEAEWASCRNVSQLATKWNDLVPVAPKRIPLEERPARQL